ncbi:PucR family transcriptional regulator [Janibacter sp. GXQ6167]|uniref:PucR family transcriptional regulator n=1 Tax=Janibacter sp. GXQ6167 TaxID=3240791 RepID=UPI003525354A
MSASSGPDDVPPLSPSAATHLRERLPGVARAAVSAIMQEVPPYDAPFQGRMGKVIEQAVQTSLGNFLDLATGTALEARRGSGVRAAHELGRGEARSGRSIDALLAAYRVGARVSWRELSRVGVEQGLDAATLGRFAELVFTYIDELSAASVAGHNSESADAERARLIQLDRLARALLTGAPERDLTEAALLARWTPPKTVTVVLLPQERLRAGVGMLDPRTLVVGEDLPDPTLADWAALLIPDTGGAARPALIERLERHGAVIGPARTWARASESYRRATRAVAAVASIAPDDPPIDTEDLLTTLVLRGDPEALADLRERALAPFADLGDGSRARLAQTLRAWLLLQGRRELVAETLHIHPQTVRYRMNQIRDLLGDALSDPDQVLGLILALGVLSDDDGD